MIDFKNIEGFYFTGIGGIGMSALASYFLLGGFRVAGYDRYQSAITDRLTNEGAIISFDDEIDSIDTFFNPANKEKVIIVVTPAIPADNKILNFFSDKGYRIYKRSEILGYISEQTDTIAIAGTHGKTTVSTMTAHLLKQSHTDCSAFLGGISKNYESNLITGHGRYTVMEADEYDRSFHRLSPLIALITAIDPDHLEIYGDHESMIEGYREFCRKIRPGGTLIVNEKILKQLNPPPGPKCFTYGKEPGADFRYYDLELHDECYHFNIKAPDRIITDLRFPFPGEINVENLTAAIAVAICCGVTDDEIRKGALIFRGVRRRFDIRFNSNGILYIDDYAHHPEEIRACIRSITEFAGKRKLTVIFQPHLFTRTRDHAEGFAAILDEADDVILLPIYPAREKPIPGISSESIFSLMKLREKRLMQMNEIPSKLDINKIEVLVTVGAGDLDTLAEPIENWLKEGGKR